MVSVDVAATATLTAVASLCTSTLYPAFGVITLPNVGLPITLAEPLVQQIPCYHLAHRADDAAPGSSPASSSALAKQTASSDRTPSTTSSSADVATPLSAAAASAIAPTTTDDGNITISDTVINAPTGTATASATLNFHNGDSGSKTVHKSFFGDPFYLSTSPIIYALAATTIVSYMLVIALFITTRSFFDGGIVYLGSRGSFTGNSSSGGVSIGGRPWLQKIAALTVAISLTIATADTMSIVKYQYIWGVTNAPELQREVMSRLDIKVIRIISDTFLWLAQAQTLIRLFPRHREKVVIKWVAFALISLDVIFSSLNSFPFDQYDILNPGRSDSIDGEDHSNKALAHPIPAISYVFKISLGLLYFIWVSYYAFLKRRFAFYHPLMKNICLVAIISVISITVPIVFFILDISKPGVAAWGDYVRWVGAAAASVVVWEWVERIEALEREEKKDGVLGREVYDGDDMLEINAAEYPWRHKHGKFGGSGSSGGSHATDLEGGQYRPNGHAAGGGTTVQNGHASGPNLHEHEGRGISDILRPPLWSQRAAQAATPVSRTDTPSAASTVYAVRYQGESRTPEPPVVPNYSQTPELARHPSAPQNYSEEASGTHSNNDHANGARSSPDAPSEPANVGSEQPNSRASNTATAAPTRARVLRSVSYSNEPEATDAAEDSNTVTRTMDTQAIKSTSRGSRGGRWDIRGRLEDFAASQADRFRDKLHPSTDTENLPVTVVPAPARVGAALRQVLEEEEEGGESRQQGTQRSQGGGSVYGGSSAIDAAASTASERYANTGSASRPAATTTRSRPSPLPLPVNQPPLWPGVNRRTAAYEDEEDGDSSDGDEEEEEEGMSTADDLSSVMSRDRQNGSSASRAA